METLYSLPVILVLTSNASKSAFFRRTLSDSYYVLISEDMESALDYADNMGVDLFIIDEKIGEISLRDLCQKIRRTKNNENTPILLVSSNLKKTFTEEALNSGINDFLREPLDPLEVHQRLTVALNAKDIYVKMSKVVGKIHAAPFSKDRAILEEKFWMDEKTFEEISKAKKTEAPLQLLMIAVDHFKKIKNEWGERAFDEALIALNLLLKKKLRKLDTLIPQGKGKYLLMLPKTSERASALIAETIRKEINSTPFPTNKGDLPLTVSIGAVSFEKSFSELENPYKHLEKMLGQVNDALAKAKKQGNKIVFE